MNKPYESYNIDLVGATKVNELTDVELTNLANGEILQYNSTSQKWENGTTGGADSVSSLTDTNITSLQDNQILRYDSTSSKWLNETLTDNDTDNLVDLTDTNISSLQDNQILKYNSTSSRWENTNVLINEIGDVAISSLANNEILKYNSTSGNWENALVLLNEIGDVNITSLQNNEVLKYNSSTGKWENANNTDTLDELSDVVITSIQNNNILKYNSTSGNFVNTFVNLTELADTNITSLTNGDILRYNSGNTAWETSTFTINDLDDVNITSVANNQVLKYNSTSAKWENSERIDTLDELGDVTITSLASNDLLRYNGSVWENTKISLNNDLTNVKFYLLANGDLIKYDGTYFVNFAPTYLDGAGISDNYLIKVVGGTTTQTTFIETSVASTSTSLQTYIPSGGLGVLAGSIETEIFDTTKTRMHLTSKGITNANGITITSDGRVGIGIVEPEEDLEVDGSIQIDSANVARLKFQKSGASPHAEGEIDAETDGTNGGQIEFYTKVDGGSVTEKLRINNKGAIGIGGTNFGTTNQVIVSNGSGSSVSWADQTDTTYSAGTGLSLVGTTFNNTAPDQTVSLTQGGATTITGTYPSFTITSTDTNTTYSAGTGMSLVGTTFSIGQAVGTSDSPTFSSITSTNDSVFDNVRVGDIGFGASYGGIRHNSLTGAAEYAILQSSGGTTFVNAKTGGQILFKIANGSDKMVINSTGVGIAGAPQAGFALKVTGATASSNGFNGGNGAVAWFGTTNVGHILPIGGANLTYNIGTPAAQYLNGYAFSWNSSSDDRLKDNETDISGALETIMKLKPQTYDFKNSEEADAKHFGLRSGFIAQHILEIPELAHAVNVPENEMEKVGKELDESGDIVDSDREIKCYLSLDYNTIFTHAVKAIQELNEEVKELKAKVAVLEKK